MDAVLGAAGFRQVGRREILEFALQTSSCRTLVSETNEQMVGVAIGVSFGRSAWIGVLGVVPQARRRRVATELLEGVLAEFDGVPTVSLLATSAGRDVYLRHGFVEEIDYGIFELSRGGCPQTDTSDCAPLTLDDLAAVGALDRRATGEDRAPVLAPALEGGLAMGAGRRLRGFHLADRWGPGAAIAQSPKDGISLLDTVHRSTPKRRWTATPTTNVVACEYLQRSGWRRRGTVMRMRRGAPLAWDPQQLFGVFNLYWG